MPQPKRQSLLAPPLFPFKSLNVTQSADGSLHFARAGIEHICRINNVPQGVFLEPDSGTPSPVSDEKALTWIGQWNALTPHRHWHLIPGNYQENQEVLVFHWYLVYRLYGCVPDQDYESAFLQRVRGLAHEAAGLHMHLLSDAPQQVPPGRHQPRKLRGSPAPF